jgi:hypothetical protein
MTTNGKTITTAEAHVITATVNVQVIRIGKKQMTLSVFRQLPRRHVIWHDGEEMALALRGEPWGLVNYFWDGCGYSKADGDHLHVVWCGAGRLYRACVGRVRNVGASGYYRGDPEGLGKFATPLWDHNGGGHEAYLDPHDLDNSREAWEAMREWDALYDQLAALPQLFIAV